MEKLRDITIELADEWEISSSWPLYRQEIELGLDILYAEISNRL